MATVNAVITADVRTEAQWLQDDPVIYENAVVYSSDKNMQYKVGNGVSKWSELSYAGGGGGMTPILSEEQPEGPCLWYEIVNV